MARCSAASLIIRPGGPADIAAVDALLTRSYPALLARDCPGCLSPPCR